MGSGMSWPVWNGPGRGGAEPTSRGSGTRSPFSSTSLPTPQLPWRTSRTPAIEGSWTAPRSETGPVGETRLFPRDTGEGWERRARASGGRQPVPGGASRRGHPAPLRPEPLGPHPPDHRFLPGLGGRSAAVRRQPGPGDLGLLWHCPWTRPARESSTGWISREPREASIWKRPVPWPDR